MDSEAVANAVLDHDAAIATAGQYKPQRQNNALGRDHGTFDGMVRHHVDRLIIISAAGVKESWTQICGSPACSSRRCFAMCSRTILHKKKL